MSNGKVGLSLSQRPSSPGTSNISKVGGLFARRVTLRMLEMAKLAGISQEDQERSGLLFLSQRPSSPGVGKITEVGGVDCKGLI